ncbi:helicase [Seminavis robusta]|uniref:Helicase n=1 Tax=Seminavis robusta TaxID=568900 RepID=A0A9N8HNK7_9STRA|nr:helicase [Seminavis robusta]|eukprot:Sro1094_g240490.1 helicase (170) ;mRNA; f:3412-4106
MQVRSASLTSENHKAISAAALKKRNWDESFEALVVYKEEFGHTNVSRSYHDHALGQWVGKQRRQQSKLTKKQRENLKSLGFDFVRVGTRSKDVWEDNFAMLAQYQEEHGDCMVDEDHELSAWVAEQRQSFLEERLPPKRAKSLESIGFQFYTDPSILDDIIIIVSSCHR